MLLVVSVQKELKTYEVKDGFDVMTVLGNVLGVDDWMVIGVKDIGDQRDPCTVPYVYKSKRMDNLDRSK